MPTLGPGEGKDHLGTIDEDSFVFGSWEQVGAIQAGIDYYLGSCPDGVLEFNREDYQHMSASFPRFVDFITAVRIGMKFSGHLEELNHRTLHFMLGDLLSSTSQYIYVGPRCDPNYFTFSAKRNRCDNLIIEALLWKCLTTGLVQIGSADVPVALPFEVHAMDDRDGVYGGTTTAPLGYIWVPLGVYP